MIKPVLYIMVGMPGSGKSTWAKDLASKHPKWNIISRDEIRFGLLNNNDDYFSKEKAVFKNFITRINECGKDAYFSSIVADATHISKASRKKLLSNINKDFFSKIVAIYMDTSVETALEQNEKRRGSKTYVPRGVIRRFGTQVEKPEFNEGFDTIIEVNERTIVHEKY